MDAAENSGSEASVHFGFQNSSDEEKSDTQEQNDFEKSNDQKLDDSRDKEGKEDEDTEDDGVPFSSSVKDANETSAKEREWEKSDAPVLSENADGGKNVTGGRRRKRKAYEGKGHDFYGPSEKAVVSHTIKERSDVRLAPPGYKPPKLPSASIKEKADVGGPAPKVGVKKSGAYEGVKIVIHLVVGECWKEKGYPFKNDDGDMVHSVLDTEHWVKENLNELSSEQKKKVRLIVHRNFQGKGLGHFFPAKCLEDVPENVRAYLIVAGVATRDIYDVDEVQPRVIPAMSFTDHGSLSKKTYDEVQHYVKEMVTEDKKFDVIFLACSQGQSLAKNLVDCVYSESEDDDDDGGLVVCFGKDVTGPKHGDTTLVLEDSVEKFTEILFDLITKDNTEDFENDISPYCLFRDLYKRVGEDSIAPTGHENDLEDGDYKYSEYHLDKSCEEVEGMDGFKHGYHFGGFLRAFDTDGKDVRCGPLMVLRRGHFQREKLKLDASKKKSKA